MKKLLLIVLTGALLIGLAACGNQEPSSNSGDSDAPYSTVTPAEAKDLLDRGSDVTFVDVRTAEEYESGHIPGAINIPNESIGADSPEGLPDKDAEIIVYCRSGRRSAEAADKLSGIGYTNVRDLGGINAWEYDKVEGKDAGEWEVRGVLSSFATTDLEGKTVDQALLKDYKLTMVNVWTTYCGYCIKEMPDLGELAGEYENKDLQIVGFVTDVLNSDGSLSDSQLKTARDIVEKTKANYVHIVPSSDLIPLASSITSTPTTFFVDSKGVQVGNVYSGAKSKAELKAIIDDTLKEVK